MWTLGQVIKGSSPRTQKSTAGRETPIAQALLHLLLPGLFQGSLSPKAQGDTREQELSENLSVLHFGWRVLAVFG